MSRFGNSADIFYQTNGSNWFAGTGITFDQSQMPQYPFEEYRVTDKQTYRNMNGDAYTYQNYNKAGYRFKWSYLDEAKANEIRLMIDSNPYIAFASDGTIWGTFIFAGDPSITEVQFELYDIEFNLEEA